MNSREFSFRELRRPALPAVLATLCILGLPLGALAETLKVGNGESYPTPCEAIAAADDGDVIEISAEAEYSGDVCSWSKSGLTIRGVGGRVRIAAGGNAAADQGIWVIDGADTVIENIEFSGAFASDGQGAAIRLNGQNLTVRGSAFFNNQVGLFIADAEGDSSALIEHSEFSGNSVENISAGQIGRLTVGFTYSHNSSAGHLVRSLARETDLYYNRFTTEAGTTAAEISLPAGGRVRLVGNIIQKGANSQAGTLLSYLTEEECRHDVNELRAINNTFVSEYPEEVIFVDVGAESQARVVLENNIFFGQGQVTGYAEAELRSNLSGADPVFVNPVDFDYRLHAVSPAVDAGISMEESDSDLSPAYSYAQPGCVIARDASDGRIDIGAFEEGAHDSCAEPEIEVVGTGKAGERREIAVVSSVSLSPTVVAGGGSTTYNYIFLSEPAPAGGAVVALVSSHPTVAAVPISVTVLAGTTSQRFVIRTYQVSSTTPVTITASYAGAVKSSVLTVEAVNLSSLSLSPSTFGGGLTTVANKVVLNGPAPSGGAVVYLSSSNTSVARPPSSVTVAAGVTTAYFNLASSTVSSSVQVQISATFKGVSKTAIATVTPVGLLSLTVTPTTIVSGSPSCVLKVKLDGPAPSGGAVVSLSSSNSAVASIPSSLTVAAGATEVFTQVKIGWVSANTNVVLSGTYKGVQKSATLTVTPTQLYSLVLSPTSTTGGTTTTSNYVRLNGPAPSGGVVVTLSSSGSVASVPASATVSAGKNTAYFSTKTSAVTSSSTVTISGAYRVSKSANLTVK